jgi:hypothetical protein
LMVWVEVEVKVKRPAWVMRSSGRRPSSDATSGDRSGDLTRAFQKIRGL